MNNFNLITALVTPFCEDERINYPFLKKLIKRQIESGINSFVLFGTTGEGVSISIKEKIKIIRLIRKDFKKDINLWVGLSSFCTDDAKKNAELLSKEKIDALLVLTPTYLKTNDEGVINHFNAIANISKVPLYLYYVPKRTGQIFSTSLYRILRQHPNISGLKEASSSLKYLKQSINYQTANFKIYSGDDLNLFDALDLKADGLISVISNIYPKTLNKIISLYQNNQKEEAKKLYNHYEKIFNLMFEEPNPIPVKYLLHHFGLNNIIYRLPLTMPSQELIDKLDHYYEEDELCELY